MDAGAAFPRTTRALREALDAAGVRPRKRHGQHFLTDVQAVDAIVRDAEVGPDDVVVEVGTGPGLLTHALCEAGATVVTYDVDADLQALARRLRTWPSRVSFQVLDVLEGKGRLAAPVAEALARRPAPPGACKLVSNLPYAAAVPILLGVLALPAPPERLVVMVQEEVGEKLLAPAGSPAYGVPSVAVGLKARGRVLRRFGPQVFWPRPKVRSVVLDLRPVGPCPVAPEEHVPFGAFVTVVFTRRRKVLPTALATALPGVAPAAVRAALDAHGLAPTARPGEVDPATFLALWRALRG